MSVECIYTYQYGRTDPVEDSDSGQHSVSTHTSMGEEIQLKTVMVVNIVYLHIPVWAKRLTVVSRVNLHIPVWANRFS